MKVYPHLFESISYESIQGYATFLCYFNKTNLKESFTLPSDKALPSTLFN